MTLGPMLGLHAEDGEAQAHHFLEEVLLQRLLQQPVELRLPLQLQVLQLLLAFSCMQVSSALLVAFAPPRLSWSTQSRQAGWNRAMSPT